MKAAAILPFLAVLSGILCAQVPAAKPGSVEGTVANSTTGEPVKKATVTLQAAALSNTAEPATITALTDASGHFHFDNVPPGAYFTFADRDGFVAANGPRHRLPEITVAEEQHVQDVAIKLTPLGVVSGHVLDEDGDPLVRARIIVLKYFYSAAGKRLRQVGFAQTNDLGEFEVLNLPPARYYFQAAPQPPRNIPPHTRWARPEEAYPATFYPNARDVKETTGADVAPGAHLSNIDFRLRKMPAYHIRGTVIGGTGGDRGTGQVAVQTPEANFGTAAVGQVQPDGSFDVRGVVSGSYEVSYQHFGPAAPRYSSQSVHVADADVNAVVLAQKPEVNVSGTVAVEGEQPEQFGLQIYFSTLKGIYRAGNHPVGADGAFAITGAPAEVSQLQIGNVPAGKYVKSIHFGDRDLKNGQIDLTNGAGASLNIVLGADGGEVDGYVENSDGQPTAAAQVILAPAEEYEARSDLLKQSVSDPSGNFRIKDVAPGEYKVFAWQSNAEDAIQSAEFRKPFESKSAAVTVGPKEKASVQLSLITDSDIEKERSKLP
jgi:hypothetical protein